MSWHYFRTAAQALTARFIVAGRRTTLQQSSHRRLVADGRTPTSAGGNASAVLAAVEAAELVRRVARTAATPTPTAAAASSTTTECGEGNTRGNHRERGAPAQQHAHGMVTCMPPQPGTGRAQKGAQIRKVDHGFLQPALMGCHGAGFTKMVRIPQEQKKSPFRGGRRCFACARDQFRQPFTVLRRGVPAARPGDSAVSGCRQRPIPVVRAAASPRTGPIAGDAPRIGRDGDSALDGLSQRPRRTRSNSSRISPMAPPVMAMSATLKAGK